MNKSEHGLLRNHTIIKTNVMQYHHFSPIRDFLDLRILDIPGVFLAGASLQTTVRPTDEIFDYDLFFTDEDAIKYVEAQLGLEDFKCENDFGNMFETTTKMKTYYRAHDNMKVQLIFPRIYTSIDECLDTFDFTCTRFAYDGHWFYYTGAGNLDTQRRELFLFALEYPSNTYERVEKYVTKKGYDVSAGVMKRIIDAIETEDGDSFFYEGDEIQETLMNHRNSQRMSADNKTLMELWRRY